MHRLGALAFSVALAGCSASLPPVSLKDVRPAAKSAAAVTDISIAPPVVTGGTQADNQRLALRLHNGLTDYDIKPAGAWSIKGNVSNDTVIWTIIAPDGSTRIVRQSTRSSASVDGVLPGIRSHLPRPSTPL